MGQYDQVVANGARAGTASGRIGAPTTGADDVVIDGRIVAGENFEDLGAGASGAGIRVPIKVKHNL